MINSSHIANHDILRDTLKTRFLLFAVAGLLDERFQKEEDPAFEWEQFMERFKKDALKDIEPLLKEFPPGDADKFRGQIDAFVDEALSMWVKKKGTKK